MWVGKRYRDTALRQKTQFLSFPTTQRYLFCYYLIVRVTYSDITPSSMSVKRKEHTYSLDAKRICISILEHYHISMSELSRLPFLPPKQDLSRWMRNKETLMGDDAETVQFSHQDHSSLLDKHELHVIGGFAIWLLQRHRIVNISVIKDFVDSAFKLTISSWWVSKHMQSLHFSSQRTQSLPVRYMKKNLDSDCVKFINRFRRAVRDVADGRKIVSVDQICFYKNGIVSKGYAPSGR